MDRGEGKSEPLELFPKDMERMSSRCSSVRKALGEDIARLTEKKRKRKRKREREREREKIIATKQSTETQNSSNTK